jgi:geranylgeranyl pyrophosphate synthase
MSGYVFDSRGKRVRPALLLLSSKLFAGANQRALKTAAAVELIHSATLVHDDIIDNASIRRSKLSVNNKFGNTAAVLFGDYLYCQAFEVISRFNDGFIAENLLEAARSMCEGEIFQNLNNYNAHISYEEYFSIIEKKTARFLSKCSALGAYCAKAAPAAVKNMEKFGLNMGMAFQIADDVLDVASDDKIIGKPAAKDLLEGKITLPLLILLDRLDSKKRSGIVKKISSAANQKLTPDFVGSLMKLCREYQTPEASMEIARKYIRRSVLYLEKSGGKPEISHKLKLFCEFMAGRRA